MLATNFEIINKRRAHPVGVSDIKDFELRKSGEIDAQEILVTPRISLYAMDFENERAVFVETGTPAELSQAPFYYQAQYENAVRVITLPFEALIQLAQSVKVDDSKLIFIHSTGRSGSTLASKIFAQLPGVINMSEPDVLTQVVIARFMKPDMRDMFRMLLDACIRLLCKTPASTAWVIKGRSWVIELGDWLHQLYPKAKNLYLYRDAESWIKSSLSAFVADVERAAEDWRREENEGRGWMKLLVPSIARYDPGQHLNATGLLSLMWLDNMQRYTELHKSGVEMLAIQYPSWKLETRRTAISMLDYCSCCPDDLTAIEGILTQDSQAGSVVSQEAVKKKNSPAQYFDRTEMDRHLLNHAYLRTADFEVQNTLKLQ
jgi:hypothetical protein